MSRFAATKGPGGQEALGAGLVWDKNGRPALSPAVLAALTTVQTAVATLHASQAVQDAALRTEVIERETGGGSTVAALGDLTDVDTTGAGAADVLTFDGAEWVPDAPVGMSAAAILAALLTVDGAGSGLDADTLDGAAHRGAVGTAEHGVATNVDAGFMAAAEHVKLTGIAAGANLYVHPNHSGDVTSSGDGAQTIANNAVTLAKLADMPSSRLIGRLTAGSGDPEALTVAQSKTLLAYVLSDIASDAQVLAAVLNVDGSGSGLDADTIDGFPHRGVGGTAEHPAATGVTAGFMSATDKGFLDLLVDLALAHPQVMARGVYGGPF